MDYLDYGTIGHNANGNRGQQVDKTAKSDYVHRHGSTGYGGASSGHGHSGYGLKRVECCPLVVDPLTVISLLAAIGGATFFLNTVITMDTMLPEVNNPKRKRKRDASGGCSRRVVGEMVGLGAKIADVLSSGRMTIN